MELVEKGYFTNLVGHESQNKFEVSNNQGNVHIHGALDV